MTIRDLPAEFRRVEAAITRPASSSIPDYVSLDDVAYATYTPASAGRALIITRGNRFIEEGLSALPDWSVFKGDPSRGLRRVNTTYMSLMAGFRLNSLMRICW